MTHTEDLYKYIVSSELDQELNIWQIWAFSSLLSSLIPFIIQIYFYLFLMEAKDWKQWDSVTKVKLQNLKSQDIEIIGLA